MADPCHCANLALKHSLEALPERVMDFIEGIHTYFAYPQRKARLNILQEEKGRQRLNLKKYVSTRWLSLGESLQRMLVIWESLKEYMENSNEETLNKEKIKRERFATLLKDNTLKLEIEFLSNIIEKINRFYLQLQNQKCCINQLNAEMQFCFNSILELISKPEKFGTLDFNYLLDLNWDSSEIQEEWFLSNKDFIQKLGYKINYKFTGFLSENPGEAEILAQNYKGYIAHLLNLLMYYLPFKDEIVQAIDFIDMKNTYNTLENKLAQLNNVFKIVDDNELKDSVFLELLRLKTSGEFFSCFHKDNDLISDVWTRIKNNSKYSSISKFFRLSQILPISSAGVEQAFSVIKLFKTEQRNSLAEETLEGMILLSQEKQPVLISNRIIELYNQLKERLNLRKSGNGDSNIREEEKMERNRESLQYFMKEAKPELKKSKTLPLESNKKNKTTKIIPMFYLVKRQLKKKLMNC